jgi:hypothetical protein
LEPTPPEELALAKYNNYEYYHECFALTSSNFSVYPKAVPVRERVPETLSTVSIDQVCYLSIDMNIAAPERAAIEFIWPKLVSGGVVVLDHYGWLGHVQQAKALDEFAAQQGVRILSLPTGQGLLLKP